MDHRRLDRYIYAARALADIHIRSITAIGTSRSDGSGIVLDPLSIVKHSFHLPALMLAAYGLEVRYNGIILLREPGLLKKGTKTDWGHAGHDLVRLSQRAKVTAADVTFLRELQAFSIWKGRYPVTQLKQTRYDDPSAMDYGGTFLMQTFSAIDKECKAAWQAFRDNGGIE